MYCRWLGEKEGIEEDQQCYPRLETISAAMSLPRDLLQRSGYRLPTEAEWEYACRGGAKNARFFGETASCSPTMPVTPAIHRRHDGGWRIDAKPIWPLRYAGQRLGMVPQPILRKCRSIWYQDEDDNAYSSLPFIDAMEESRIPKLVHRGGSFTDFPDELRSAKRVGDLPNELEFTFGFRIARTLKP